MWNTCFIITVMFGASHQRATVLITNYTNDNPDTVNLKIFVEDVNRWRNISFTYDETIVSPGLMTDESTKRCPPCICGVSSNSLGIVGGNSTFIQKYRWMAYIQVKSKQGEFSCGGSLINNKYVMTAAHCVVEQNGLRNEPKDVTIQLLRLDWFFYTEFNVTEIIVHEKYNPIANEYDIALLHLDSELDIGQESNYNSVCLPYAGENFVDYNGIVTGWGRTSEKGDSSYVLREVVVPIMSNEECRSFNIGLITDDMMCAGYKEGGKDSCQGDSGGPLLINNASTYYVVGIVSWGIGCALPKSPGVYTRVNRYLDWLAINAKDACWCSDS